MQENNSKTIMTEMETFINEVRKQVEEGMDYRDAMLLQSAIMGGNIAALVSQADVKYQEATYKKTELSQQPNVDECALASMGKLWHGENFEGSSEYIESSDEEIVLDSFYFILKYANAQNALEASLAANESVCGDKTARKAFLEMMFA